MNDTSLPILDRAQRTLASVLRSPSFAVVAAYGLRMLLFWLSHHGEDVPQPRFATAGQETSLIAWSIATGRGFFGPFPGYETATAWLAPVFPFLCAIGYKLFRLDPYGAFLFCQTMNCAFSAATCWPIYALGKKVFGERIGLASAWLWVVLPYAVLMPLEWTWDQSLSALMLALLLYAGFCLCGTASSQHWFGYALLWAFSALVNPSLCLLLPFLLGWLVVRRRKLGLPSRSLVLKTAFVFVLALLPWTVRNYFVLDGFVFVKSNFGLELWLGNNSAVKEIYSAERHPISSFRERLQLILSGEPNYNQAKLREAVAFIQANPRRFLELSSVRFMDVWTATHDSSVEPWITAFHLSRANVWFCSAFSIVSFAGMMLALRASPSNALPLASCLLLFPIPYYITHTSLRYRHPIDPIMTIFTVYVIARSYAALAAAARGRFAGVDTSSPPMPS